MRIVALAALLCAAPLLAQFNTLTSVSLPPERFRGETEGRVAFVYDVKKRCGMERDERTVYGCRLPKGDVIVLPHPCLYADREWFAYIACHESGHRANWSRMHEE